MTDTATLTMPCLVCSGTGIDPGFGDACTKCAGGGHTNTAVHYTPTTNGPTDKQIAFYQKLLNESGLIPEAAFLLVDAFRTASRSSASKAIDQLLAANKAARATRTVHTLTATRPVLDLGFYMVDGDVYEVVKAKAGHHYAMLLDPSTGRFEYAKGAMVKLTADAKMTLEQASAFGHAFGRCCCCGATLTNPDSIERGIGPICAGRFS